MCAQDVTAVWIYLSESQYPFEPLSTFSQDKEQVSGFVSSGTLHAVSLLGFSLDLPLATGFFDQLRIR